MRFPAVPSLVLLAALSPACSKKEAPPEETPTNTSATPTAQPAQPATPAAPAGPDRAAAKTMFGTLPAAFESPANAITPDKVALGRTLYHDARLSKNQDVSCATCHDLTKFGVDNLATSKGHKGQLGTRNSPTVFNAAGATSQFWDGRAADVEAQAKGPVLNPVEMAMKDEAAVVAMLTSIPDYKGMFEKAFPGEPNPVTFDNMAKAIGAFERGLVTPAPFDKWLAGDDAALSDDAKKGLALFMATGCNGCHSGPLLGGTMFMKVGAVKPYENTKDTGRFEVTKAEADKFSFKVPSLRNVAKTAPYFHDGAVADLPAAVAKIAELQLGKQLTADETKLLVAFLDSLTGEPPAALVAKPEKLPASSKTTPKPDPS